MPTAVTQSWCGFSSDGTPSLDLTRLVLRATPQRSHMLENLHSAETRQGLEAGFGLLV